MLSLPYTHAASRKDSRAVGSAAGGAEPHTCWHALGAGDFVDRGAWGLEVLVLLLAWKLALPHRVFLLRGELICAARLRAGEERGGGLGRPA